MKSVKKRIVMFLLAALFIVSVMPVTPAFAADGLEFTGTDGHRYQITSVENKTAALIGLAEGTTEFVKNAWNSWSWKFNTGVYTGETFMVNEVRLGPGSANAEGIKKIDFSGMNDRSILNLTKIDVSGCTNLEELLCDFNALTELDVSKNAALRKLTCSNNSITKLDISGCAALEYLSCSANAIKELDVGANKALTYIQCGGNPLTELDVSKNTALTELWCAATELTELNLSGLAALKTVYSVYGQLAKLDVSGCTSLETLSCYENAITELDVTSCTNLKELNAYENQLTELDVSKNAALTSLSVRGNNLTEIDVSNNPKLRSLYCGNNRILEVDISKNPELRDFHCSGNRITKLDMSNNPHLREFYCSDNLLTELDLSNNLVVQAIDCSNNKITELDVVKFTKLYLLKCSGNNITSLRVAEGSSIGRVHVKNCGLLDVIGLASAGNGITIGDEIALDMEGNKVVIPMTAKGNGYESVQQYELNKGSTISLTPSKGVKYDPVTKRFTTDSVNMSISFATKNPNYTDKKQGQIDISGTITFTLEGEATWENPFTDVEEGSWYYPHVAYVHQNGLFSGTGAKTFGPRASMTRGMVVTVLGRLAGVEASGYGGDSFSDVDTSLYYAPYIKWAAEAGIVSGVGQDKFAPDREISRQDLAVILNNYANTMELSLKQTLQNVVFADSSKIAAYAADAVGNMVRAGVIGGKDNGSFDPVSSATRAEVATMLHRFSDSIQ